MLSGETTTIVILLAAFSTCLAAAAFLRLYGKHRSALAALIAIIIPVGLLLLFDVLGGDQREMLMNIFPLIIFVMFPLALTAIALGSLVEDRR